MTDTKTQILKPDLIYPELSYQILGALFNVWNEIGYGHKENLYHNATQLALKDRSINYEHELPVAVNYKENSVGTLRYDFLIENKIVLEIKVRNYFSTKDIEQLYSYLRAKNLKLGILAHFTRSGVKFKRIVNLI